MSNLQQGAGLSICHHSGLEPDSVVTMLVNCRSILFGVVFDSYSRNPQSKAAPGKNASKDWRDEVAVKKSKEIWPVDSVQKLCVRLETIDRFAGFWGGCGSPSDQVPSDDLQRRNDTCGFW